MPAIQLELNLWDNLDQAAAAPIAANLNHLWQQLEEAIAPVPQQLQLQIAAEAILKIVQIYASRSEELLSSWEEADNPTGPVLAEDMLAGLVRQTMTLDLTALLEPPEPVSRNRQTGLGQGSVAGTVDQTVLLEVLEDIQLDSAATPTPADPLAVVHSEDVSTWVGAIAQWMQQHNGEAVSLLQMQQGLGMPLVDVWLGLLLSQQQQYVWEQQGDFYHGAGELWLSLG